MGKDRTTVGLSRRTVVSGLVAGAAASWLGMGSSAQALPPRTRYDLKTPQGRLALAQYRDAVKKMRALPENNPLSWDFQANIHAHPYSREQALALFDGAPSGYRTLALGDNGDGIGGVWWTCSHAHANLDGTIADDYSAHFTAWHRLYLWHFERICEKVLGRPFALPYWNYLDITQLKLPAEILQERVRVNAKWIDNPLHFKDRRPEFVANGLRAINGDQLRTDIRAKDTMKSKAFFDLSTSTGSFRSGFVSALDQAPHGTVHVRVGTDDGKGMGAFETAARDPIFWLHHANIDRLWESWRAPAADGSSSKDPRAPKAAAWLNKSFVFAGADSQPSRKTARESLSLAGLGYRYDNLQPVERILFAAPNAEQTVVAVTTVSETSAGDATVGQDNAPVVLSLVPALAVDRLRGMAQDGGNQFWLIIDVETRKNPNSLFQVQLEVKKSAASTAVVAETVQTFNFFNVPMRSGLCASCKAAWQVDLTDWVRGGRLDLSKPIEIAVVPVGGDASGIVTVHHARIEVE